MSTSSSVGSGGLCRPPPRSCGGEASGRVRPLGLSATSSNDSAGSWIGEGIVDALKELPQCGTLRRRPDQSQPHRFRNVVQFESLQSDRVASGASRIWLGRSRSVLGPAAKDSLHLDRPSHFVDRPLALMDSVSTATPSPLAARSATASGALACSTMSGLIFPAAQAWSNMVRGAVPSGMHTTGNGLTSARLVRLRLASGWSNGTAATSRSLVIGRAEGHQYLDRVARSRLGTRAIRKLDARSCDEPYSWITPAPSSLWLPACGSHRRALA